jgi:hypothetical protein
MDLLQSERPLMVDLTFSVSHSFMFMFYLPCSNLLGIPSDVFCYCFQTQGMILEAVIRAMQ